jgi:hypothetical protein
MFGYLAIRLSNWSPSLGRMEADVWQRLAKGQRAANWSLSLFAPWSGCLQAVSCSRRPWCKLISFTWRFGHMFASG